MGTPLPERHLTRGKHQGHRAHPILSTPSYPVPVENVRGRDTHLVILRVRITRALLNSERHPLLGMTFTHTLDRSTKHSLQSTGLTDTQDFQSPPPAPVGHSPRLVTQKRGAKNKGGNLGDLSSNDRLQRITTDVCAPRHSPGFRVKPLEKPSSRLHAVPASDNTWHSKPPPSTIRSHGLPTCIRPRCI